MTIFRVLAGLLIFASGVALGQTPSVPKLPHINAGQMPGPKDGYVPDKETAIKIAEVILFRLYGEKNITRQRPYVVTKDENIWWVCGTGHPDELGSLFKIAISQQTGAILYLEE